MIARLARRLRTEEGASLVEFSLVSVLLVIMLLSVVEIARMVLVYTTIADAASAGTRYAIVNGSDQTSTASGPGSGASHTCTCTAVKTVVNNYAAAGMGSINTSNLTITVTYPDSGGNGPGQHVLVTVQYTYQPLIGYFNRLLNTTLGSQSEGVITY